MVNVALLAVLLFRFLKPRLLSSKMSETHDRTVERFGFGVKGGWRSCMVTAARHYPLIFGAINLVLDLALGIALYVYFDGNCFFNNFRTFDEDDEFDNSNYTKGFFVLLFYLIETFAYLQTYMIIYDWKNYGLGSFVYFCEVVLNIVIVGLMVTTAQCMGDTIANRYWISGGLYLFYIVWQLFQMSMALLLWVAQSKMSDDASAFGEMTDLSSFGGDAQLSVGGKGGNNRNTESTSPMKPVARTVNRNKTRG